ncbi:MAG TPA: hypothetical protein VGX76_25705, partial [Pirellulales bacterium]|nr:hypothetical protein [Pirellulales bacterium]
MKPAALRTALLAVAMIGAAAQRARSEADAGPSHPRPERQDILFLGPLRPLVIRLRITVDGKPFREAWLARFDELFALADRDKQGRVTVEDGDAIARDMSGSLRENTWFEIKKFAEPDGRVERAALLAYVEKTLPPFVIRRRASIDRDS